MSIDLQKKLHKNRLVTYIYEENYTQNKFLLQGSLEIVNVKLG